MKLIALAARGGMLAVILSLAGSALFAQPTAAPQKVTAVEGITEYRLANGLRVLLFPDPTKPVVTINCTVFVGSRQEGYGETGMAHLLEHMLFKGTPTFPNVPKALRDHGANNDFNGTTWVDRTNYYETMPATDENLEFGIKLEADRLVHSLVRREDLISEMTVVRNEFEIGENNPEMILSQRIVAAAFEWHNYGKSTIGNRADIERVPIESLQRFYRKHYQPDNAMLVVAGQFDEKAALKHIQTYFGAIPKPTRVLDQTYTEEPTQDGERSVTLRRVGSVGAVGAAYHVPAGAHPDFPAVEVLATVLDMEPGGRLYKALVETKKASKVGTAAFAWHDPGLLEIGATCAGDKVGEVRDALIATLEGLHQNAVTDEDVNRAKVQLLKARENLMADSKRVAIRLSEWAGCGDWRLFFLHRDRLEKVTAADVNRVAMAYLKQSNRTVGVFIPTDKPIRAQIAAAPNLAEQLSDYKGRGALAQGEAFDPSPANIDARLQRTQAGNLKLGLLPKKTRGETVMLQIALRVGTEESLKGKKTAFELLASMLDRGTTKHSRQQIRDALDKLGSKLSIRTDVGLLHITLQSKRANLAEALDLVAEILREPTFPEKELELLKAELLDEMQKGKTEPQTLAFLALERKMHPYAKDDFRYVPTIDEELERIKAVTVDQIKSLYSEQISAQTGEVAVVGDFTPATLTKQVTGLFADWKAPVAYRRIPQPAHPEVPGGREIIHTPEKTSALFLAGLSFAIGDAHPDYPALEIGNFVLGGGSLTSRLATRVRQKDGLSYEVGSHLMASPRDEAARYFIYAMCNPKNMEKLDAAIADEIAKFLKDGPTPTEVSEAQKAWLQTQKVGRTSDSALATRILLCLSTGRTFAFYGEQEKKVQALSADDVTAACRKHLRPKNLVIIKAGDLKK